MYIYFVILLKEEVHFEVSAKTEETQRIYFLWSKSIFGLNVFTSIFFFFVSCEQFESFKNKLKQNNIVNYGSIDFLESTSKLAIILFSCVSAL